MGGGGNGKVKLDQLKKDLQYTILQPKELGLDSGDAGEPGMGLSRQVWPGPICSGWTGGRAQVDKEGWGSKVEKIYRSSGLSAGAGASGVLGSKRDWEERKKDRQVQFALLRFLASLGQRREERAVPEP